MNLDEVTLDVSQEIEIKAAPGDVYRCMISQLAQVVDMNNKPLQFVLEEWPGGRWFRDLGNGQGHLWGFVQVSKPPTLLEINGPMMMSYPAAGHLQMRVTPLAGGTLLELRHRAFGLIEKGHRENVTAGWAKILKDIKAVAEDSK
jgi:hypothetical protein